MRGLSFYCMNKIMDAYYENYKNDWEKTRYLAYIIAQVNSTKTIKPTDVLKFSWDADNVEPLPSAEEQDEMRKRMIEFAKSV